MWFGLHGARAGCQILLPVPLVIRLLPQAGPSVGPAGDEEVCAHLGSVGQRGRVRPRGLMLLAGLAHFAFQRAYQRIVPRLVATGILGGLERCCRDRVCRITRRAGTRRAGALGTIAVLLAVFPANVEVALDGGIPGRPVPLGSPVVAWARLPLQVPKVIWAWRVAPTAGRGLNDVPCSTAPFCEISMVTRCTLAAASLSSQSNPEVVLALAGRAVLPSR